MGLSFSEEGIALVWVDPASDRPLKHWEMLIDSPSQLAQRLAERVETLELGGVPCYVVLAPEDYSLQLVEAPDVPAGDVASAVKFQIRDSLAMSLADAEVQVFDVPEAAYRPAGANAVCSGNAPSTNHRSEDLVLNAGLVLQTIDIRESVMRDLAGQMAEDRWSRLPGRAWGEARLLLMKAGEIYLSRQLNTEIDQSQMAGEAWASTFQRLLVELQRSFDYFENQMGQGQILRLLLAPVPGITNQLIEQLEHQPGCRRVRVMDLNVLWNTGSILSARDQYDCLFASGAALAGAAA